MPFKRSPSYVPAPRSHEQGNAIMLKPLIRLCFLHFYCTTPPSKLQLFLTRSKRKERTDFLGLCAFCALCAAKERPGEIPALNYWFKYSALAKEPDAVFPPP